MLIDQRRIAGFFAGCDSSLDNTVVEWNELMSLLIIRHMTDQMAALSVEPKQMRRIDGVLHRLKPIAIDERVDDDPAFAILPRKHVPAWQQRLRFRSHVGVQKPGQFLYRISLVSRSLFEGASLRLRRLLQTFSSNVELPAMIGTAYALLIHAPERQRRRPVRTVLADQSVTSRSVAKDDE